MILSNLVYMVVKEVQEPSVASSWLNIALNIITTAGTIGAVIVALYLSGEEARNRKKLEEENAKKVKQIIILSLNNIVTKMDRYSKKIKEAKIQYPYDPDMPSRSIYRINQTTEHIHFKAYNLISSEVNTNKTRDYEYIVGQLDILRKIDLNVLPTNLIVIYHKSYTSAVNLEQWLLRISNLKITAEPLITYIDDYMSPLTELLDELKDE